MKAIILLAGPVTASGNLIDLHNDSSVHGIHFASSRAGFQVSTILDFQDLVQVHGRPSGNRLTIGKRVADRGWRRLVEAQSRCLQSKPYLISKRQKERPCPLVEPVKGNTVEVYVEFAAKDWG